MASTRWSSSPSIQWVQPLFFFSPFWTQVSLSLSHVTKLCMREGRRGPFALISSSTGTKKAEFILQNQEPVLSFEFLNFSYLAFPVIQAFIILVKFFSNFECNKVVLQGAVCVDGKRIPILLNHFLWLQQLGYLTSSKVDTLKTIFRKEKKSQHSLKMQNLRIWQLSSKSLYFITSVSFTISMLLTAKIGSVGSYPDKTLSRGLIKKLEQLSGKSHWPAVP